MTSQIGMTASGATFAIRPGRSTAWWGMVGLIVTESMLFLLLLFSYFYFRAQEGSWPPADLPEPSLVQPAIRSAILLGSTVPMVLAERALEHRGSRGWSVLWQLVALAMGAVFLAGHVREQFVLVDELSPQLTAYGSVVMTILNFHGAHLAIGMLALGFVTLHTARGAVTQERPTILTIAGMYWHFVDVIWAFVFSTIYLSPHLLGT